MIPINTMKYMILDEKIGKRFIFNNEDLSKLPPEIIQELTCFLYNPENEASFFVFNVSEYDEKVFLELTTELEEIGFELIQE